MENTAEKLGLDNRVHPENTPDPELGEVSFVGKTVVICLGNRYMRDDGIGIQVAEELRGRDLGKDILVYAHQTVDLSLLWVYKGASRAIFVDALKSGETPGTISKYTIVPNKDPLYRLPDPHSLQLADIFEIGSQTGLLTCPVTIIGIEPKDCSVGEGLSTELASVVPTVVNVVVKELGLG